MFVLGITGKAVSGKSMVAEYLSRKHNFVHLDFTKDLLAPILKERNKPVTRTKLVELALELRKKGGNDALIKHIKNRIEKDMNHVIAGIRYPEEVHFLRNKFQNNFKLLAVKCGLGIRFKRTLEIYHVKVKSYKKEKATFEEFMKLEKLPTEKIIKRTMRMADFSVTNDGTKEELFGKIDNLVKRLKV